ncbi:hypothetical protein Hdeb2414_s0004g00141701 [Helianthus debilis subsp. tardiflorus]
MYITLLSEKFGGSPHPLKASPLTPPPVEYSVTSGTQPLMDGKTIFS